MSKIKLGNRPKNFKHVVTFPMLDGTTGTIEVLYKYRTVSEFGQFIDKMSSEMGSEEVKGAGAVISRMVKVNAEYLLQVIEGWNLDEELNEETAHQLANELPAAAAAIMNTYRQAIVEQRLGN
ncbi:phage tail assembly chaperone [uncultured Aquabacterium sp.]|uniref:phage tail assembly chaperone n=1 Tax=uncultured Aquabacterium sp. TaxID=158753 RepID=UPI0025F3D96D|nr:phage tail assembly chaperone [uncultured Aquabacterium sp.]